MSDKRRRVDFRTRHLVESLMLQVVWINSRIDAVALSDDSDAEETESRLRAQKHALIECIGNVRALARRR
jgi:hypothetical protein